MQAKGWGTNRLFMSPYGTEFAREGQAEAVAGTICAAEEAASPRRKLKQSEAYNIRTMLALARATLTSSRGW